MDQHRAGIHVETEKALCMIFFRFWKRLTSETLPSHVEEAPGPTA